MVTITVTDVNEAPTVMGAASIDHEENGTVLDTDAEMDGVDAAVYTATDEDDDDDAGYRSDVGVVGRGCQQVRYHHRRRHAHALLQGQPRTTSLPETRVGTTYMK